MEIEAVFCGPRGCPAWLSFALLLAMKLSSLLRLEIYKYHAVKELFATYRIWGCSASASSEGAANAPNIAAAPID